MNGSTGFFARRWRGEVAYATLFVRDTLVVGSLLNLVASFAAMALAAAGAPPGLAAAVHFAPVPYNAFLLGAILRAPWRTPTSTIVATAWFVVMTLA